MAKRNSTKTATKEAYQASEPKISGYNGWQGISIKEAPMDWGPLDNGKQDSSLKPTFLMVQNNVITTSSKALETRLETQLLANAPTGYEFTGVSCLRGRYLYCACKPNDDGDERVFVHRLDKDPDEWDIIPQSQLTSPVAWTCLGHYQNKLIGMTESYEMLTGDLANVNGEDVDGEDMINLTTGLVGAKYIPNPTRAAVLTKKGSLVTGSVSRISVSYIYTNKYGTTLDSSATWATVSVDKNPVEWSAAAYLNISGNASLEYDNWNELGITGIDLYCRLDENEDAIFIGHVDFNASNGGKWEYNWLGAMSDTSVWTSVSLTVPTENTTAGVKASYFRHHDGRLYFWGGPQEYRLYIGGNPGNELSVARGLGGAFVDIDPGSGLVIHGTAKFKTYNGASIVTIMCGNRNSGAVKRFNLLENTITVTSELTSKSYSTEEVANVVGCNSNWGYGVYADGLYAVNRYGLMVTTNAMESNNQLRAQPVSDPIQPVFTDLVAKRLDNARMIYIDEVLYIVFGDETNDQLDAVILCYDINAKAWYTLSYEDPDADILHIFNVDSYLFDEGIGVIEKDKVCCIPVTGKDEPSSPEFCALIETPELSVKNPPTTFSYLSQIEFHFDYIVGDLEIKIEGTDYYGRERVFIKQVSVGKLVRHRMEWVRINELLQTHRITIRGYAKFRLTHFVEKLYQQSTKIAQPYGWDSYSGYINRHGDMQDDHHYLESYNNLRDCIVT